MRKQDDLSHVIQGEQLLYFQVQIFTSLHILKSIKS